jgi:leader peptidase (prepilin peptidase)/N-methyltransferase
MIIYYILFFILGLATGFLINDCIYRIPEGKPIIALPSQCRHYDSRILAGYPFVKFLTGVVFVLLFYRYGMTVEFISSAFLMSVLIVVFFIDIHYRIIPDILVLVALAGGVLLAVYNIFTPVSFYGDRHWWNPLVGILSGAGFLFLVAVIGMAIYKSDVAMGMGDVKIFAPIGIFLGWRLCMLTLMLALLTGGLMGLFLIISGRGNRKSTIAFGPFIVLATFISLMWGWDIYKWYISAVVN